MSSKKRWKDLTTGQRVGTLAMTAVQLSLAVTAWVDLARRESDEVNGSKKTWAAIIAINYIGPILFFVKGRKRG